MPTREDFLLGDLAVKAGLTTRSQVHECLSDQEKAESIGMTGSLGNILVAKGILTSEELGKLTQDIGELSRTVRSFGRFEIINKLAPGPLGSVYRAYDPLQRREVCLRLLAARLAEKSEYLDRLFQGLKRAVEVEHPALVRLFDLGEFNGRYFVSQEYVAGMTAVQKVAAEGPLGLAEAAAAVRWIAQGLAEADAEGPFPADVKPQNLLLSPEGPPKLADFGWIKETRTGWAYLAPEELGDGGVPPGPAGVVYSLGACLYFLVSGRPPLEAADAAGMLELHRQGTLPRTLAMRQGIPEAFDAHMALLMAKKPEERPASLEEVVRALQTLEQAGRPGPPVGGGGGREVRRIEASAPAAAPEEERKPGGEGGPMTPVDAEISTLAEPSNGSATPTAPVPASAVIGVPTRPVSSEPPAAPARVQMLEFSEPEAVDGDSETATVGSETKWALLQEIEQKRKAEQTATRSLGETAFEEGASSAEVAPLGSGGSNAGQAASSRTPVVGAEARPKGGGRGGRGRRRGTTGRGGGLRGVNRLRLALIPAGCVVLLLLAWAAMRGRKNAGRTPSPAPATTAPQSVHKPSENGKPSAGSPSTKPQSEAIRKETREQAVQAAEARIRELELQKPVPLGELVAACLKLRKLVEGTPQADEITAKVAHLRQEEEERAVASFESTKAQADALFAQRRYRSAIELVERFPQDLRVLAVMPLWRDALDRYRDRVMEQYLDARSKVAEWTEEAKLGVASEMPGAPTESEVQQVEETLSAVMVVADGPTARDARLALEQLKSYGKKRK
ncbi:MAG: protein kinase [Planctomycetes bacterium]|nr:protein kinase [Planctomycetota bacterium]